jgi:hypothetical protein
MRCFVGVTVSGAAFEIENVTRAFQPSGQPVSVSVKTRPAVTIT